MGKHDKHIIYLILLIVLNSLGLRSLQAQEIADNQSRQKVAQTTPDASLGVLGLTANQVDTITFFQLCSSYTSEILTFTNTTTTTSANLSYTINWGDGSADFTTNSWTSQSHTYKSGHWVLTYTVTGIDNALVTKRYHIYIVSNPAVSLGSPGNTDNCSNVPLTFPITGTENNPPNTTYTISFNDGTPSVVYKNYPPKEITHTFTKSSCGTNSVSGSTSYPNSFSATIVASNSCGVSSVNVVPIYISTAPVVDFDLPKSTLATNAQIYVTNKTTGYVNVGASCSVVPKLVWKITPSTGFTLNGGSLGTDNNSDNSNLWVKGLDIIAPVFTKPGIYKIKLRVDTKRCGTDSVVKTICVEAPLVPKYDLDYTEGCAPMTVKVTNATDLSTTCSFTSSWSVAYTASYGGSLPVNWSFAAGFSANGTNSGFVLKTPGTYKIRLTMTNAAGSYYVEKTVIVKQPPVLTINSIAAGCGVANIHPTATVNVCTPTVANVSYLWEFPGGTPSSMTSADPGFVKYNAPGVYTVKLTVTNECGSTTASRNFTINNLPVISAIVSQHKKAGQLSDPVNFTASENSSITWVNSNTKIGLAASGSGNIGAFVLTNNTDSVIRGKITVYATSKITGCSGVSQSFEYIVNPSCDMLSPESITVLSGQVVPQITFATDNTGGNTTYAWSVDSTSIGISKSGFGNIPSFTAMNSSNKTVVATITVVPSFESEGVVSVGEPYIFTISVMPLPQVDKVDNLEFCNGNDVPEIKFTTSVQDQKVSYKWTNKNTKIGLAASGDGNIPAFRAQNTGTGSQTAIVTVTPYYNDGRTIIAGNAQSFRIVVNPGASIIDQPQSLYICRGGKADSLRVSYENGTSTPSYQWYENNNNANYGGVAIQGATSNTYLPSVTDPGTKYYYCIVSFQSGLCKNVVSHTATVQVNDAAYITQQPGNKVVCIGGSVPLNIVYNGGAGKAGFQWYVNKIKSTVGATPIPGGTDSVFTPSAFTATGHYYYFVQLTKSGDGCGNVLSDVADVEVVSNPVMVNQPVAEQAICKGFQPNVLSVSATGGTNVFHYQWYVNRLNNTVSGVAIANATDSVFVPQTDTVGIFYYYCQLSQPQAAGCSLFSRVAQLTVSEIPVIVAQPGSATYCASEKALPLTVRFNNGNGKPLYQWFVNTVNSNTSGTLIPGANSSVYQPDNSLSGTSYYYCSISFTDGGCAGLVSDVATITFNPASKISSRKIAVENDKAFTVSSIALPSDVLIDGTKYSWTSPKLDVPNSIKGAQAQTLPVDSISFHLTNVTDSACSVTYTITPVTGSCVGTAFELAVIVFPNMRISAVTQPVTCFGASTGLIVSSVRGGVPFNNASQYLYRWVGPNGFEAKTKDISGLKAGKYTLSVVDSVGNTQSAEYQLTEPDDILMQLDEKQDVFCANDNTGKISVTVSGGVAPYTYRWTKDSVYFSSNEDLVNLQTGEYHLTVTDANGCIDKTATYKINQPAPIAVNIISKTDVLCFGDSTGAVIIDVKGGTPDYKYVWKGDNGFSSDKKDIAGLKAGAYSLTVVDANGCNSNFSVVIKQPEELEITASVTPISCYGANNGKISIQIKGGLAPYTIGWSNLGNGMVQANLSAGTYVVIVTDANNCQKSLKIVIAEPQMSLHPVVNNVTCHGAKDGNIQLNVTGGIQPVTIVWADDPTAGNTRNHLAPGLYTVTVKDAAPCSVSETFLITEPDEIGIKGVVENALVCENQNSGSVMLTVAGGTAPYSYQWSNGTKNRDLQNAAPGIYYVVVTDSKGCSESARFEILRPKPMSVNVVSHLEFDCNLRKLKRIYKASVDGGFAPYKLTWSSGNVVNSNPAQVEVYSNSILGLEVTDSAGCSLSYTYNAEVPSMELSYQMTDCNKLYYQFFLYNLDVNLADVGYTWDFGDGETSTSAKPVHLFQSAGVYVVKVTVTTPTCSSSFEQKIYVDAKSRIRLDKLPKVCKGDSIELSVSGATMCKWSNGVLGNRAVLSKAGTYSVVGTTSTGCKDTLSFELTNYDTYNYTIMSDSDQVTSGGFPLHFWSENIPYTQYFWDFGDGKSASGVDVHHAFGASKTGYYDVSLKAVSPDGCVEVSTKRIWVKIPELPNTFSPNGDGMNDLFMENWEVKVYSRNGVLMYAGRDGWDGKYKGQKVSEGIYFYIVYYPSATGTSTANGYVRLIR